MYVCIYIYICIHIVLSFLIYVKHICMYSVLIRTIVY